MIGTWAVDGKCKIHAARLVITATTAALGTDLANEVEYDAKGGWNGRGALIWAREGNVDHFEYDAERKEIVYYGSGFDHPATAHYEKCRIAP
jgi:hypothetical protein